MYIGNEPLRVGSQDIAVTVNDFWRWSFSDFTDFTTRAAFAEFLVASSLGLTADNSVRLKRSLLWSPAGGSGIKVSVRTAAYVQSGEEDHPDHILFPVPKDHVGCVYVFCVFKGMVDGDSPLNTDLWDFYALRASTLDGIRSGKGFVTLPALLGGNPVWSDYYGIGRAITVAVSAK